MGGLLEVVRLNLPMSKVALRQVVIHVVLPLVQLSVSPLDSLLPLLDPKQMVPLSVPPTELHYTPSG
jgi:hypothetical protein